MSDASTSTDKEKPHIDGQVYNTCSKTIISKTNPVCQNDSISGLGLKDRHFCKMGDESLSKGKEKPHIAGPLYKVFRTTLISRDDMISTAKI